VEAKYINPFLNASINLFKDYLKLELKNGKPYIRKNPRELEDVSAMIGLAGETTGAVVLSFSREVAIKIASHFAGEKYKALGNEVLDAVGELINIIAGNSKKYLADFRIDISLPGVIIGESYKIHWPENVPVITIPFSSNLGDFTVNVSLKNSR
jgi:chemotaxis protein CheX